jgi:glycosyltransferase involved in cell wall biosynthesis
MHNSPTILIPTMMRLHGETGVQTYFNSFHSYLYNHKIKSYVITPFLAQKWLVFPIFGLRKIIDPISGIISVWWYRYWHYLLLKQVLKRHIVALAEEDVVIFAQCPLSAKAALETRTSKRQKVVMVIHYNISQADEWVLKGKIRLNSWLYNQIKELESEVIQKIDKLVHVSDFMKTIVEKHMPSATEVESIVLPTFSRMPVPLQNSPAHGDLISIGTLEPRKNHSYILSVLAEAKKLGYTYSLTLVGDGPSRNALEGLARSLNIDDQVNFLGFQPDAASLLHNHRIYVHSALLDNKPIALLEALACSRPVLAAPVGGIPECFSDGVEGFYWLLDNPSLGAQKLIELMEDSFAYAAMQAAAKKRFVTCFDQDTVGKELLNFLIT